MLKTVFDEVGKVVVAIFGVIAFLLMLVLAIPALAFLLLLEIVIHSLDTILEGWRE